MPSAKAILERYMAKFSKGGKVDFSDDFGLDLARTGTSTGTSIGSRVAMLPISQWLSTDCQ